MSRMTVYVGPCWSLLLTSVCASGGMADALASGASVRKDVGVQVPPRAPLWWDQ
jgi:hypothetical protein